MQEIAVKTRGRPLLVGEYDIDIQTYNKALRKAGTPASVPVVLADAEGVKTARNISSLLKYSGNHNQQLHRWSLSHRESLLVFFSSSRYLFLNSRTILSPKPCSKSGLNFLTAAELPCSAAKQAEWYIAVLCGLSEAEWCNQYGCIPFSMH